MGAKLKALRETMPMPKIWKIRKIHIPASAGFNVLGFLLIVTSPIALIPADELNILWIIWMPAAFYLGIWLVRAGKRLDC